MPATFLRVVEMSRLCHVLRWPQSTIVLHGHWVNRYSFTGSPVLTQILQDNPDVRHIELDFDESSIKTAKMGRTEELALAI
jgi:hypothetical protein